MGGGGEGGRSDGQLQYRGAGPVGGDGPHGQDPPQSPPSQGLRGNEASKGRAKEEEKNWAEAEHRPLGTGTTASRIAALTTPASGCVSSAGVSRLPAAPLCQTRSRAARIYHQHDHGQCPSKSRRLECPGD
ncbi:hypothetical protein PAL_GLEAN10017896 [Pteropus alecto]|uniref:Uncharacterized protein n=1 Tax=Pteropus alecto TaxID=9402 RepID=L5KZA9_PTEAL|nr:hypothetical protein PAL_GLEAN10017896 [Pteropus alecto]